MARVFPVHENMCSRYFDKIILECLMYSWVFHLYFIGILLQGKPVLLKYVKFQNVRRYVISWF